MKNTFMFILAGMLVVFASALPQAGFGAPPPPPRHHHRPPARPAPAPHHHHHKHSKALGIGAGILGAGLIASTIYDATRPAPVVVAQPAVVAPAPVVVAPAPVVVTPAPVVVQQPVATGHYETRVEKVWVEGRYVDQVVNGVVQRVWQPGHYEERQTQVWVTP